MNHTLLSIVAVIVVGAGALAIAHPHEDGEFVKEISTQEIKEKLDGKEAAVTMVEVTIEPGKAGLPHRHPGPGFVYVIEGEYELGIDDEPVKRFKAGESYYEPTGCLHRVSRNPSKTKRTRLIAAIVHPRGVKQIAVPEKSKSAGH